MHIWGSKKNVALKAILVTACSVASAMLLKGNRISLYISARPFIHQSVSQSVSTSTLVVRKDPDESQDKIGHQKQSWSSKTGSTKLSTTYQSFSKTFVPDKKAFLIHARVTAAGPPQSKACMYGYL